MYVLWGWIPMKNMAHPCVVGKVSISHSQDVVLLYSATLDQAVGIQGLAFAASRWSRSQSRWSITLCSVLFFCFFCTLFYQSPNVYWVWVILAILYHMFVLLLKASSPLFLVGGNPRICCFKWFEHSLCWSRSPVFVELSFFFVCSSLSSFTRKIPVATIKYAQRKSIHWLLVIFLVDSYSL